MLLFRVLCHVPQKSRLTRARLSCEEERTAGEVDYLQRVSPLFVVQIQFHAYSCSAVFSSLFFGSMVAGSSGWSSVAGALVLSFSG